MQALLCCAFYEVGKGNLSKGWMYSGELPNERWLLDPLKAKRNIKVWRLEWARIWGFKEIQMKILFCRKQVEEERLEWTSYILFCGYLFIVWVSLCYIKYSVQITIDSYFRTTFTASSNYIFHVQFSVGSNWTKTFAVAKTPFSCLNQSQK